MKSLTLMVIGIWVLAVFVSPVPADPGHNAAYFKCCIDKKIECCQEKARLCCQSKSRNLKQDAQSAQAMASYLRENRHALVNAMVSARVAPKPHSVQAFLTRAYKNGTH